MNKKLAFVTVCALILLQACTSPSPTPVVEPAKTATLVPPTSTPTPTVTPTSTPTPIPLAWTQVYDGQDFERDTVAAFATDKTDPNIIYAGMKNSGVYKTVDEGLTWSPVNQGLASKKVESLLIDSQNPLILYAGTVGGIFKTVDGGKNWSRIGEGTYLLMDVRNNSHLYARNEDGIYETTDRGNTWKTVYALKKDCPNVVSSWVIHPTDGNTLFIGGGEICAGVYKSTNSGGAWSSLGLGDKPDIDTLGIRQDEDGNFSIYANFRFHQILDYGIYVLRDGSTNWSFTQGILCNLIASAMENPAAIYCHDSSSLYVLRNDGTPWRLVSGSHSKFYSAIHIDHPNGTERIITSGAYVSSQVPHVGIFISTDGGAAWIERISGIGSARSELKIDSINSDNMYLAAYYMGSNAININCTLFHSLDGGKSWSPIKGRADWCGPTFDLGNDLYLMERGRLQKSYDGGDTWIWKFNGGSHGPNDPDETLAFALPNYFRNGRYFEGSQSISANPFVNGLLYDVGDTIYYKTGSGWQLSEGSEGSWDGRLFYTDQSKMIFAIGRHHQKYSTDNGMTWQACGEDVTTAQSDSRLALDLQGERLYLATPGQGVLVSTDKCGSWQESNNGLGNLFVNTVAIDPNNSDTVYAGTDGGAYVSFDGGATWGQINDGLIGSGIVYSIAVDSESNVYAATPYGMFKLEQK